MKVKVAANHVENFLITRHANELTMEAFKTLKAYVTGVETKQNNAAAAEAAKKAPPPPQNRTAAPGTGWAKTQNVWTEAEEAALRSEFASGLSAEAISKRHNRSIGGIAARLVKLGIIARREDLPGYAEYEATTAKYREAQPGNTIQK